jgi:fucose permease
VGGGTPAVVWGCTAALGFAVAPQFPLMISFAGRHMELAARTTGWFVATAGVANLTLPWCIGQLIDRFGADAMPKATFACSVAVLLALWRVARVARLRPPERFRREVEDATPIASA